MEQQTPVLRSVPFPDGSAHVGVPDGWSATTLAKGMAILAGPDGAAAALGCGASLLDPRGSVAQMMAMEGFAGPVMQLACAGDPARVFADLGRAFAAQSGQPDPQIQVDGVQPISSPMPGWVSAALSGTETLNGVRNSFQAWLSFVQPQADGMWSALLSIVAAPVPNFSRDLPTLLAIANSLGSGAGVQPAATPSTTPNAPPQHAPPPMPAPAPVAVPNFQAIAAQSAKDMSDYVTAESAMAETAETNMEKSVDAFDQAEFGMS